MSQSNYVHLEDCTIVRLTDKAVRIEYEEVQYWIPVSQLADGEGHTHHKGDENVTVSVTEWIANQIGIEA